MFVRFKIILTEKKMVCKGPFTSPKMLCACPNILCQTKRWFAFSKIGFCAGTFEEALNADKFLGWLKKFGLAQNILRLVNTCIAVSNQIYLVMLRPTQLTQTSFLQKSNVAKCFFDIFNAEIAQCHQTLDVILGIKVVQFWSYQKMYFTKNVVLNWYFSMKNWLWMSRFHDFWHHCAISALQI